MLIPTLLIGLAVALLTIAALVKYRDTFNPAVLIGPMLGFHYCYSPLFLHFTGGFYGYLSEDHVARAQWINLTGVLALCVGIMVGSAPDPRSLLLAAREQPFDPGRLLQGSIVLGALGIGGFMYGIAHVGGLSQAYGSAYGGGWAESGWARDLWLLCLPAMLLLTISQEGKRLTGRDLVLALAIASPFLIHGLLGARRGPTFMGTVGFSMVFYMARKRRPRLLTLAIGGSLLGLLMLFLVSNRDRLYLGTDLDFEANPSDYFRPGAGNDFIYGAGLVVVADETQNFNWGTTYLTILFVRPIPRTIWPTKYDDAAEFFGRPSLIHNLGVDRKAFQDILGWTAALGAASGIIGDMWREFGWGMLVALFGMGWFYGFAWRQGSAGRRTWVPIYCMLASLSLYFVMQTLEAILYRFLFGLLPMLLVLRFARAEAPSVNRGNLRATVRQSSREISRPRLSDSPSS